VKSERVLLIFECGTIETHPWVGRLVRVASEHGAVNVVLALPEDRAPSTARTNGLSFIIKSLQRHLLSCDLPKTSDLAWFDRLHCILGLERMNELARLNCLFSIVRAG
jgi:hypothetical protein